MLAAARLWLALATLNGMMAVGFGAFGAHGAKDAAVKELLRTGAQYQLVHAAAALACFALMRTLVGPANAAGWLFGAGGLLFGGSLYALALTGVRGLGAVTPVGGLLLLAGWGVLLYGALVGYATPAP